MISINLTLFIQMINFFVLLFLMNVLVYRPIRRIVAQRNQLVNEQESSIAQAEAQVAAVVQEFEREIQGARNVGRQKVQELKEVGYNQEKDLLQQAAEKAAKQLQEMREKVRRDIAAARKKLKSQVQSFAGELAQKILGRTI
jgi:F-type H+-transporting ATPase subunit b